MNRDTQLRLLKTIAYQTANNKSWNDAVLENLKDAVKEIPVESFSEDKPKYVFNIVKKHYEKYGNVLTRSNLQQYVDDDTTISEEDKTGCRTTLDNLSSVQVEPKDYSFYKDIALKELNKNRMANGISSIVDLIKSDKVLEAQQLLKDLGDTVKPLATKQLSLVSANQLQKTNLPPVKFIVQDIIPEGLTMLAAQKKAGKSAFVMQMGTCIAQGKPFLGRPTTQGKVIYYSMEQSAIINKERLEKQGLGHSDNFFMITDDSRKNVLKLKGSGIEQLKRIIEQNEGVNTVIIDTWQKLAPDAERFKNAYEQSVADLSPLQEMATEKHIAIVILTHTRKVLRPSEDPFDDIMGSNGLMGTADNIIMICRKRNQADAVMHLTSRVSKELRWVLNFNDENLTWNYQGNYAEIQRGESTTTILDVFKKEAKELSIGEIWGILQVDYGWTSDKYDYARVCIGRLVGKELVKTKRGHYQLSKFAMMEIDSTDTLDIPLEVI